MGMTIDNVLEILEKHKLRIPSNVFYELKADIVNFEEPTTKDDAPENNVGKIEPTTKNDLGVDCIDRKELIDWINTWGITPIIKNPLIRHIQGMPSVTPIRPKGHWITRPHIYGVAFCSECGFELKINNTNYCPNCGCRMVEPQESEG